MKKKNRGSRMINLATLNINRNKTIFDTYSKDQYNENTEFKYMQYLTHIVDSSTSKLPDLEKRIANLTPAQLKALITKLEWENLSDIESRADLNFGFFISNFYTQVPTDILKETDDPLVQIQEISEEQVLENCIPNIELIISEENFNKILNPDPDDPIIKQSAKTIKKALERAKEIKWIGYD